MHYKKTYFDLDRTGDIFIALKTTRLHDQICRSLSCELLIKSGDSLNYFVTHQVKTFIKYPCNKCNSHWSLREKFKKKIRLNVEPCRHSFNKMQYYKC